MRKSKFIKNFDRFDKKEKTNEEIGWETIARAGLTGLSLMGGMQQTIAKGDEKTISFQQAKDLADLTAPNTKIRMIVSRATRPLTGKAPVSKDMAYKHYAWYNHKDIVSNLPGGTQTHYLVGTKKNINDAINGTGPILGDFKFISRDEAEKLGCNTKENWGTADVTDYIKIGNIEVEGAGGLTTDLSVNDSDVVVISGNYLWTLIRMVQQQRNLTDKIDVVRFEVGGKKLTQVDDFAQVTEYNMNIVVNHSYSMKTLYYLAECSLDEAKSIDLSVKQGFDKKLNKPTSTSVLAHSFPTVNGKVSDFVGKSDDEIAEEMTQVANRYLLTFLPTETVNGRLEPVMLEGYQPSLYTKDDMLKLLADFKSQSHDARFDNLNKPAERADLGKGNAFDSEGKIQLSNRDKVFEKFVQQFKFKYVQNLKEYCNKFFGDGVVDISKISTDIRNADWKFYEAINNIKNHVWSKQTKFPSSETKGIPSDREKIEVSGKPGEIKTYDTKTTHDLMSNPKDILKKESFRLKRWRNF